MITAEDAIVKYQLISFKTCPWVQRAAIILREKAVPFEFVHITSEDRPDWFGQISPHGKVPVLRIDDATALFESGAIAEFLDDSIAPRLHPMDLVQRAINRAWTDYIPAFSAILGATYAAQDEDALTGALQDAAKAFGRIEQALAKQGAGPFFNGADYALVDAGYAPFLQRWLIAEDFTGHRLSLEYPRLRQWTETLIARPTTHSFPPDEFRALYLQNLTRRGGLIAERIARIP